MCSEVLRDRPQLPYKTDQAYTEISSETCKKRYDFPPPERLA